MEMRKFILIFNFQRYEISIMLYNGNCTKLFLLHFIYSLYSIAEENKSRLRSGNACYNSAENLLSSRLLPKNSKIKIYRTITLSPVLYGCETWLLTLR